MSSDWYCSGKRRDARHMEPRDRPGSARKDTKRWCRGIAGREHVPECDGYRTLLGLRMSWHTLRCKNCGKHLPVAFGGYDHSKCRPRGT